MSEARIMLRLSLSFIKHVTSQNQVKPIKVENSFINIHKSNVRMIFIYILLLLLFLFDCKVQSISHIDVDIKAKTDPYISQ